MRTSGRTWRGITTIATLLAVGLGLTGGRVAPAAPQDFQDFPIALAGAADGGVWMSMFTDTLSGGAVLYDADLQYRRTWRSGGITMEAIAGHPTGDLFAVEQTRIRDTWFTTAARYTAQGELVGDGRIPWGVEQVDVAPNGDVLALIDALGIPRRVERLSEAGALLRTWTVNSLARMLAAAPGGDVYVGDTTGKAGQGGRISRFDIAGRETGSWDVEGVPAALGVTGDGSVVVGLLTERAPFNRVEIFDPSGKLARGWDVFEPSIAEDPTQIRDLAVGPAGDIYVLLAPDHDPDEHSVVVQFDSSGLRMRRLTSFVGVTWSPSPTPASPATRTSRPRSTATASPTGTPPAPGATSRPDCPRPTRDALSVAPVDSPTFARSQVIRASLGHAEWIEVESPLGTIRSEDGSGRIEVPLVPSRLNGLTVRGRVRRMVDESGCVSGDFMVSTRLDRNSVPLDIEQRSTALLPMLPTRPRSLP